MAMGKSRFVIKGKSMSGEVFFLDNVFIVQGNKIQKLQAQKLVNSNTEELKKQLLAQQDKETKIDFGALQILRKIFGEFELVY